MNKFPFKIIENFEEDSDETHFKKTFRNFIDCIFLCVLLCYAAQVYWYDM